MGCSLFANYDFQMGVIVMGFAEDFGLCLLFGLLWQLKVPLVYFINGQKGGLDCTPLYLPHFSTP